MSKRRTFDIDDLVSVAKVAVYSGVSAALAVVYAYTQELDVDGAFALFVPVINSMIYAAKRFFEDRVQ